MKLEKYKKLSNGRYKVTFEKETSYILYEDVILKHNLLVKSSIDMHDLELILKDNSFYETYYLGLNYLKKKLRTEKEIEYYLEKKDIDKNVINKVIDKLKSDGYINGVMYIKSYIHDKLYLSSDGPYKIKRDLEKLGFSEEEINNELNNINEEEWKEKAKKLVIKKQKSNNKYSSFVLNKKIYDDLINKGYSSEMFSYLLSEEDNDEIRKKEYDKLYNKLSKKYSGNELEYKLKQEMYKKGFKY